MLFKCFVLATILSSSALAKELLTSPNSSTLNFNGSTEDQSCSPYQTGETRAFSIYSDPASSNYSIQKNSESVYTIFINLKINGSSSLREGIQNCLTEVNKIGLGPEGIQISLKLFDPEADPHPAPAAVKINVQELDRPDAGTYRENQSCGTTVHEMLHVAGLVDEYQEKKTTIRNLLFWKSYDYDGASRSFRPAFDCRSYSDGIMGTLLNHVTQETYAHDGTLNCACPKSLSSKTCEKAVESFINLSHRTRVMTCPWGMERINGTMESGLIFPAKKKGSNYSTVYPLEAYAPRITPLRSAHLRKLLWPQCLNKNEIYDRCTANAYRTSKANGGEGCEPSPSICQTPNAWLQ
jgi:hypothetical protein